MGGCGFYNSWDCGIYHSPCSLFQKEQGEAGREKQPETIPPDYERGLCDNGDMSCGYEYVYDGLSKTKNTCMGFYYGIENINVNN